MLKEEKILVIILTAFSFFLLHTILYRFHDIDESTHSLSGIFIRDFIKDWLSSPTFSFKKIYEYGLSYLTYYPKISLHYPPIPQLFFGVAYIFFSPSIYLSRGIIVILSLFSLTLLYYLSKLIFKDANIGIISVLILMGSPIFITHSIQALQEIPFLLFFTSTIYLFLRASNNIRKIDWLLLSISTALCVLSKWQAITIIPILFFYSLFFKRKVIKKLVFSFLVTSMILSPYYLIMLKSNFLFLPLRANVPSGTSPKWYEFLGAFYYVKVLFFDQFFFPVGIFLFVSTCIYIIKKKKYWNLFLVWILISFFVMTFLIENKNPKYTINTLPAFIIPSSYLIKPILRKKKILFLFSSLIFLQFLFAYNSIPFGFKDVEEISKYVVSRAKGNILIDSILGGESPFIFEIAKIDNFEHQTLRPCIIEEYNDSFSKLLNKFDVEYIIQEKNTKYLTERQKEFFSYLNSSDFILEKEYDHFMVFKFNNLSFEKKEKICNYVCSIKDFLCSERKKPLDFLK